MSHYINSWCSIHGDIEVDSDNVPCDQCAPARDECYAAIRDHLGGKPELVCELVDALQNMANMADAAGWSNATKGRRSTLRHARALLSRIKEAERE